MTAQESPLDLTEELAQETTRRLIGSFEFVGLLVQGAALLHTAAIDRFTPTGQAVVHAIAAAHLAAAALAFFTRGPFARGRIYGGAWLGMAFLMPLIMANLVQQGEYGASPACVQACGYPAAPLVFFAFYPWLAPSLRHHRLFAEILVVVALCLEPLVVIWRANGTFTEDNIQAFLASSIPYFGAFILGKSIGTVCRNAAMGQLREMERAYRESVTFLHSHVESSLGVAHDRYRADDRDGVLRTLRDLGDKVIRARLDLLNADRTLNVAKLIELHIRRFGDVLDIEADAAVNPLTVRRPVGIVFDHALGSLLKNVLDHVGSGTAVHLTARVENRLLRLAVADSGAGPPPGVLDRSGGDLHQLRREAREIGGDLTVTGSRIELFLPLRQEV